MRDLQRAIAGCERVGMDMPVAGFFTCDVPLDSLQGLNAVPLFEEMINTWVVFIASDDPARDAVMGPDTVKKVQRSIVDLVDSSEALRFNNWFFDNVTGLRVFNPTVFDHAKPQRWSDQVIVSYESLKPQPPALGTGFLVTLRFLYKGGRSSVRWPWLPSGSILDCAENPPVALLAVAKGAPVPHGEELAWHEKVAEPFLSAARALGETASAATKTLLWGAAGLALWQLYRNLK